MDTMPASNLYRLAGAALAIFGLFWLAGAIGNAFHGIISTRWPTTEARLIHTEVVATRTTWTRRQSHTYTPYASYHFTINDHQYTADVISFGEEFLPANRQLENLRKETPLLAHYDPDDPNRAVLHPGVTFGAIEWLIIGFGSIGLGLFAFANPESVQRAFRAIPSFRSPR